MGMLETILPDTLKQNAFLCGSELMLECSNARAATRIVGEKQIAVLGVEVFEKRADGLATVTYSGYDREISSRGDWKSFAESMNIEAEK